jgi:hypothetical protein
MEASSESVKLPLPAMYSTGFGLIMHSASCSDNASVSSISGFCDLLYREQPAGIKQIIRRKEKDRRNVFLNLKYFNM